MYNVRDFGALGNGENLDSVNIQKAIDECAKNGGGTIEDRNLVIPDLRDGYPECNCIGKKAPVFGLIARYVDNLKLYNVDFYTDKEDARDAIYLDKLTRYKNV